MFFDNVSSVCIDKSKWGVDMTLGGGCGADDVVVSLLDDTGLGMPIMSRNMVSSSNKFVQELASYKELRRSILDGDFLNAFVVIENYFGHVDYGEVFGYVKTHGELVDVLLRLLVRQMMGGDDLLVFVDRYIRRLEVCVERGGWL